MFNLRTWLSIALVLAFAVKSTAAPPPTPLVEVPLGKTTVRGKVVAQSSEAIWLMGQDGRLQPLTPDQSRKERRISPQFSAASASVLRDQLRHEFGKSFDVVGSRHYAVCAVGDRKARTYADTFEELFRSFQAYFSVRGFKIHEPEFPLVAVVFPDRQSFERYARAEKVSVSPNLKGYYSSTSNRIALYEEPDEGTRNTGGRDGLGLGSNIIGHFTPALPCFQQAGGNFPSTWDTEIVASIEASLKDTMIHEATHQAAFNTGLHTRLGESPKWVVEGLATVFEAPGIRNSGTRGGVKTRINRERFVWFGNFAKSRRVARSLETFLATDDLFKNSPLDAYSQAWAFTFFLIETRPHAYADCLRTMAARDPMLSYSAEARVADFKRTVSKELPLLEAEFLRFIAGIK